MNEIPLQPTSLDVWGTKYQLETNDGVKIDRDVNDMRMRVSVALASGETDPEFWTRQFMWAQKEGAVPAGRILSNSGAECYKPSTSLINCTVAGIIEDSLPGIMDGVRDAGVTLGAGCGIGYEFSTLRPENAHISGAGASTSGPLPFMDIYDKMCLTISSSGGRRGAQMATFAIWHPDVEGFIEAKREDGRFRQFNCSLLIDDEFMKAVKEDTNWQFVFPIKSNHVVSEDETIFKELFWDREYCESQGYVLVEDSDKVWIECKVYKTIKAKDLWSKIMYSTYNFSEPGFLLIDEYNRMNNNYFCEIIRKSNPCGEQGLPDNGSCLLGSINLVRFILMPFSDQATFDWEKLKLLTHTFTRMLDNVIEYANLPLQSQRDELIRKRRHGMGYTGLGSALTLLGIKYGSKESLEFTDLVSKTIAIEGYRQGIQLAKEKGEAPVMTEMFDGISGRSLWINSKFMARIWEEEPELLVQASKYGCRFTHATSIAPTGTISLSVCNNVSNGIEPTFAHKYTRNMIIPGKKTKVAVDVYSYEMLLYKDMFDTDEVPNHFSVTDNVTWKEHVDVQAAAQKWVDSSISKTINVPSDIDLESFIDVYMYAYDKGLKGCTTFRYNPKAFQGVLVKQEDLNNTWYIFDSDTDGEFKVRGSDMIEYDGDTSTAANLYDSLKEGTRGKY